MYESDDDPDLLETSEEEEMEEDEEEEGEVTVSSAGESSEPNSGSDDIVDARTSRTRSKSSLLSELCLIIKISNSIYVIMHNFQLHCRRF